jgi:hypothetical protein
MRKFLRLLAVTSAALCSAGSALAGVITFDNLDPITPIFAPNLPFTGVGDFLIEGDHAIGMSSLDDNAQVGDLVGAIVNGSDPNTCVSLGCPGNNASNFLASINGGLPYIFRLDGGDLQLRSFDAAFLGASGAAIDQLILLVVGFSGGALAAVEQIELPPAALGDFNFSTYKLSWDFITTKMDEVDFIAFGCDVSGCTPSAFSAQFALDNVSFVPEPASLALVGLALAAAVTTRRRRQATGA